MTERRDAKTEISVPQVLFAPLRGLWEMIVAPGRHAERLHQVELLRQLGDEQLAARGFSRSEILAHVYGGPLNRGPVRREATERGEAASTMTAS